MTDIAIVIATFVGPFGAVYVTERQRKKADARNRKVHIFRTLMATRAAFLATAHIEALNLIELEFAGGNKKDQSVVDRWALYNSHLNDVGYSPDHWPARRKELMVDLLYAMSQALGYPHRKSDINTEAYYPKGYAEADQQLILTRKLLLEVLEGKRPLPMRAEVYAGRTESGNVAPSPEQPPKVEPELGPQ